MAVILCVDDEPAFLELTRSYLSRSDSYEIDLADSAEAALDRISSRKYDAIVSDYQMPVMDGLELLKLLREQGDDTPFIVFTGKGREEVAIEALNLGADFYLQKGSDTKSLYAELSNMIDQLVGRRTAEVSLIESEERYRGIFENSGSAMAMGDSDGRVLLVNKAFEELTGFKNEDIEGKMWTTFIYESSIDMARKDFETRKTNPENAPTSYEIWLKRKDGSKRLVIASPKFLPSMKLIITPFVDITHIRDAEAGLARMNRMFEFLSHVNQAILRSKNRHELFPLLCQVAIEYGKLDLAWVGLVDPVSNIVIPEAWAPIDNADIARLRAPLNGNSPGSNSLMAAITEHRIVIHSRGVRVGDDQHLPEQVRSLGYNSLSAIPLRMQGRVIGSLNLYSKKSDYFAEDDLGLLREIAADVSYALSSLDFEDRLSQRTIDLARRVSQLSCLYTVSELSNQEGLDFDGFCARVVDALSVAMQHSNLPKIRMSIRDKIYSSKGFAETSDKISASITMSGVILGSLEVFHPPELHEPGNETILHDELQLLQAVAGKIGEAIHREQMSQELNMERAAAQKYLDLANVMIVVIDRSGIVSLLNKKGCEILGYHESEVIGKNWFDNFLPPESRETVKEIFETIIGGDISRHEQVVEKVLTKSGEIKIISWHNTYICDESGKVINTISSGLDISENTT